MRPRVEVKGIPPRVCLALSQAFMRGPLAKFSLRQRALGARFESHQNYVADRVSALGTYRDLFSGFCRFSGQDVLELGCSAGYLLAALLDVESFQAFGADLDPDTLARGRAAYGDRIRFLQSTPSSIPLGDASIDVIYTVDTVEHLSRPRDIFIDCHRILRPGGRLLVHFQPWLGPWGSHLEDIIPFPWPHVVFSMDTLLTVAAHIYDSDGYQPACYWLDPETGQRRDNPYLDHEKWREFLNHMTIRQFMRLLHELPFEVVHLRRLGFGGRAFAWTQALRGLAQVPVLDEFFSNSIFAVLEKRA